MIDEKEVLKILKRYEGRMNPTAYFSLEADIVNIEQYAEPKTGHWIMTGDHYTGAYEDINYVKCSCCGEYSLEEGDYCPNCGAKMESENKG